MASMARASSPIRNVDRSVEDEFDTSLRPSRFAEFRGQKKILDNLKVYIAAARKRGEPLDHVLFIGPPDLAKQH